MSLEALNELLALLAYEGVGNKKCSTYDAAQQFINWPLKGKLKPSERSEKKETDKERAIRDATQDALKEMESLRGEQKSQKSGKW